MIRSSSAVVRRIGIAAGALIAGSMLSACSGGPAHTGAAAVVGDQRITTAAVQARIAAYRTALEALPGASVGQEPNDLTTRTVSDLVLDSVVSQALADHHLTVSNSEVAQARAADVQAAGGEQQLENSMLVRGYIPPGYMDALYREQIGLRKLVALQGQDIQSATDADVRKSLATASADVKVVVNPRFGSWDPQQVMLNATTYDWLPSAQPAA